MRLSSPGAIGVLAVGLVSSLSLASSNGITGRSGKQTQSCMAGGCHSADGAPAPTVELSGPSTLNAGETGQYSLIIRGGPAVEAGMNAAVSDVAAALQPGSGQRKQSGELTHSAPVSFISGEARFDFSLVAPATPGPLTLYGAGNSTNGNHNTNGDFSAATTLAITIVGGSTDGGTGGPPDAGPGVGNGEEGGCGCSAGSSASLFPLLALLAVAVRRRRASPRPLA